MANLAFRLGKASEIKSLAPVIAAALNRGINITIISGPSPHTLFPKQKEQNPLRENIKFPGSEKARFLHYQSNAELPLLLTRHNVTNLITLNFPPVTFGEYLPAISRDRHLFCLQATGDFLHMPPSLIAHVHRMLMYSELMTNTYLTAYPTLPVSDRAKFIAVGNPVYDILPSLDPDYIRHKYNLPSQRNIILLASANPHVNWWRHYVFSNPNRLKAAVNCVRANHTRLAYDAITSPRYISLIKTIKNWCQKNNALLVIKSKLKHKDPNYVRDAADFIIGDENGWYPLRFLELAAIAKLTISFNYSTSMFDAIAAGSPSLQIGIKDPTDPEKPELNPFISDSYSQNPNVCLVTDHRQLPQLLSNRPLSSFRLDVISRSKLLHNYFGFTDNHPPTSANTILDIVMK